jgi:hypothetical protein
MAKQVWGRHTKHLTTSQDNTKEISTNEWNDNLNRKGHLGFDALTIASASTITPPAFSSTPSNQPSSLIKLSGSTSIDTIAITNTNDGDLLYVVTTGTVTLNNTSSPSSAGDIRLLGNANKDLDTNVPTILIRSGDYWYEYGGSPVTDASITFAKIQNLATMKVIGRTAGGTGVSSEVTILDSDTMSGASDSTLATSESIKAYVDNNVSSVTASSTTTFTNKTIDADATGNSITNIENANIKASAGIDATKIADGTVTSAEFQYINTLSSNAQTQLDEKLTASSTNTLTNKTLDADGTGNSITNIEDANIKASAAIDATKIANGTVTSAEFQYLGDVTSLIQAQIDGKSATAGNGSLVTVGALNSGSITSGFGAIDNGASAITTTGTITGGQVTVDNFTIADNKIEITNTNGNLQLDSNGTGVIEVLGNTNDGAITLNCTANSHGQTIKSQPHSAAVTNTMLLPAGASSTLVSLVSADTLTNKTLTSPVINVGSDADGDLYYRASGAFARLAKGTAGQTLKMNSGATAPEWAAGGGGNHTQQGWDVYTTLTPTAAVADTSAYMFTRKIDSNNDGLYIQIWKNGASTTVQVA